MITNCGVITLPFGRLACAVTTDSDGATIDNGIVIDMRGNHSEPPSYIHCCGNNVPLPDIYAGWHMLVCPVCNRHILVLFYWEPETEDADGMWE